MMFLADILEKKRLRVRELKKHHDVDALRNLATSARGKSEPHRLSAALREDHRLNIIAEFKKASPSKGAINENADPREIAVSYERGGGAAISVLTEQDFFKGSLNDLRAARRASSLPILRKDFIVDEFQIYEAAEAGADAILLIVAALERADLERFQQIARVLRMDAMVEVHTADEMNAAVDMGATLIGVNNRNLSSFEVSLDVSRRLIEFAPYDAVLVSESGLKGRDEMLELKKLGYHGFLIGESLMRSDDPGRALRQITKE